MPAGGPPKPDLAYARAEVLALIAGSPMNRAPHLEADVPLGNLPPELEAKLAHSGEAQTPAPAVAAARRAVVPAATLATLDALGVVVAAATGHVVLAVLTGVLFLVLAAIVVAAWRYGRDPNALTGADRRAIAASSRWTSKQDWSGAFAGGDERGLVIAATHAAARVARSPAWRSGQLDEQRVRLDLRVELDQIDEQAHRIAEARARTGPVSSDTAVNTAWESAVDRVAALMAYAGELDGSARRRREDAARLADPVRDGELLAGSTLDRFSFDHLVALTTWLGAQADDAGPT
jgi:hypothetical protein